MDLQDAADLTISFASILPQGHSNRDHEVTKWITAKHASSYNESECAQGQFCMTDSEPPFLPAELQTSPVISWDTMLQIDNLLVDQCQTFMTNDQYQFSDTSGSLPSVSHSMFDPLVIDSTINLPNVPYATYNSLAPRMAEDDFPTDFVSGPISYDSSSSVYISPPSSPAQEGQHWSEMPNGYSAQFVTAGPSELSYRYCNGISHHASSPPSPPISDDDHVAVVNPVRSAFIGNRLPTENSMYDSGSSNSRGEQDCHRKSDPCTSSSLARVSSSTGQSCVQPSRPSQRILKPASEKPKGYDQGSQPTPPSAHGKPKEKPETAQPRNHHLYKALPGKDGLFRCPFVGQKQCTHVPTKQKCGYDKYLDSHLKPYQCKHGNCSDLRFSSNACLFRHEREAHGMHFYGKNPHRCHFAGCDRASEGFPRRWNLHDHMRRVHKYDASLDAKEEYSDCEVPSKRKGSGAPSSCSMKRTSSSQAKARAASASYSRDDNETLDLAFQPGHAQSRRMSLAQGYDMVDQHNTDLVHGFSTGFQQPGYGNTVEPRMSYGLPYA